MNDLKSISDNLYDDKVSVLVYQKSNNYLLNNTYEGKVNVRSISKTILALACGIVIDRSNDFNEETKLYPIIKDKVKLTNKSNQKFLEKIKIKHLLTHTVGYRDILLMSKDLDYNNLDLVFENLINYPIYYKAGEHFLYSNASYYLLSACLQEYLGMDLYEFIEDNIFEPLNITCAKADRWGKYLAGATKFYLSAEDLLKLGEILIYDGSYEGKKIVNPSWIKKMKRPYVNNSNELKLKYLSEDKYGYGLWISDNDIIFASGTGGQLIVIIEKLGIILVGTNVYSDSKSYKIKNDIDKMIDVLLGGNINGLQPHC